MFSIPARLSRHRFRYDPQAISPALLEDLRKRLSVFRVENPEVTIAIPAYNEEKNLLNTLSSLADIQTRFRTELIIANNNSKDRTQEILDACGVRSVLVTDQGIGYARQAALLQAKGTYVLNADCDCLYPTTWVDALVTPLETGEASCTYGTYSFLPSELNSRTALAFHELISRIGFRLRIWKGLEFINVLGFNFAFRRADGLAVGGFRVDAGHQGTVSAQGVCEDGWMAMSLLDKGKIVHVTKGAHVWTDDRVLNRDGGVWKAFRKRIRVEMSRVLKKPA
ncbi:glycosyltransferase family 2 protein [Siphonobacter aquaeclarae]|jgi:glycosyltransferase involved in cell wall biosynthesis|uniref:Glycosyl transferase family 2 n=1 Tax=Siphonobacter aquaeclarae TaxID=563176 RepID=A0A1G9WSX2_9BACT|nr:glycosyltransferase family 2 protein [Siphonobacter aquaeclarae]SDM87331.1 Glycosyl transferase family 2 [Siphonobacter aquaeclarae]